MNKRWQVELVRALHGGPDDLPTSSGFDGGTFRGVEVPKPVLQPAPAPSSGDGWGPEVEIEDGAELFFPWLRGQ